jgi:hypothetical protein
MTHEEKLDEVMRFIMANNNNVTYRDFDRLVDIDEAGIKSEDLDSLLRELMSDPKRYVYFYGTQPITYYVETAGKIFIGKGGYVAQAKREQRLFDVTNKTYYWVIIGSVAALIGTAFLIYEHFSVVK